eukprot:353633-Chlamydomonas_euryale.AAC.1
MCTPSLCTAALYRDTAPLRFCTPTPLNPRTPAPQHFYVIYCKFWELDTDHDFFIDRNDLAHYSQGALSLQVGGAFARVGGFCRVCLVEGWLKRDGKRQPRGDSLGYVPSHTHRRRFVPGSIGAWATRSSSPCFFVLPPSCVCLPEVPVPEYI